MKRYLLNTGDLHYMILLLGNLLCYDKKKQNALFKGDDY